MIKLLVVALLSFPVLPSPSLAADWPYSAIQAEDGEPLVIAETGDPNSPAILFIHGDAVIDAHLSVTNQALTPDSARVRHSGTGHAPFLEAPASFNKGVMQCVDDHTD
jgi:hypothetical protein